MSRQKWAGLVTLLLLLFYVLRSGGRDQEESRRLFLQEHRSTFSLWYREHIKPLMSHAPVRYLEGARKLRIAYRHFEVPNSQKVVMISPGFSEPAVKYSEVVANFIERGYGVVVFDHRGQGDSEKVLQSSDAGYVHSFQDYYEDAAAIFKMVQDWGIYKQIYGLGVSMGAAVLTGASMENMVSFERLVLAVPMLKIQLGMYPHSVAQAVAWAHVQLGLGDRYVWGKGPWSDQGFGWKKGGYVSREYQGKQWSREIPQYRVGGPSFQWLMEALAATQYMRKNAELLKVQTLILAAEQDAVVDPSVYPDFCGRARACSLDVIGGSHHEILHQEDAIRHPVIAKIISFSSSD
ncbi:MAG: alpha/beta fold hydrolase [Zetaproteobacteria bacterium]|nr:alpha/beta fold hydrolase [Zetaproteobacteria bacterium]